MARVLKAEEEGWISEAVAHVRRGNLIVFPTETVYGIGVSLDIPENIVKLQRAKGRDEEKPITLMAGSVEAATEYFNFGEKTLAAARKFFPGPLTLVMKRTDKIPGWFFPGRAKIGLRVPDEPTALALLAAVGELMAVTSANASKAPPAVNFETALFYFANEDEVLIIDGGESKSSRASTVAEIEGGKVIIIRPGPISKEELEAAIHG